MTLALGDSYYKGEDTLLPHRFSAIVQYEGREFANF